MQKQWVNVLLFFGLIAGGLASSPPASAQAVTHEGISNAIHDVQANAPIDAPQMHKMIDRLFTTPESVKAFFEEDGIGNAKFKYPASSQLRLLADSLRARALQECKQGTPERSIPLMGLVVDLMKKVAVLEPPAQVHLAELPPTMTMPGIVAEQNSVDVFKVGIDCMKRWLRVLPDPIKKRFTGTQKGFHEIAVQMNALQQSNRKVLSAIRPEVFLKTPAQYTASEAQSIKTLTTVVAQTETLMRTQVGPLQAQFAREATGTAK